MSGECTTTPGHRWQDDEEPITTTALDQTGQPLVQVNPGVIGVRELVAGDVLGIVGPAFSSNRTSLVNANFDIWQRGGFPNVNGLPLDLGTTTAITDRWGADHWGIGIAGAAGRRAISQQAFTPGQTAVPNEPTFYMRWNQTISEAGQILSHAIEDVRTFSGQTVTASWWMKSTVSKTVGVRMTQWWGGSPAPPQLVGATTNFNLVGGATWAQFSVTIAVPKIATTAAIAFPNNCLALEFVMPTGVWQIDIAQVQIIVGTYSLTTLPPFIARTRQQELTACRRYFEYTSGIAGTDVSAIHPMFFWSERKYADFPYVNLNLLPGYTGTGLAFNAISDVGYAQNVANSVITQFFISGESEIYIN